MSTIIERLDMLVKAMTTQNISPIPIQQTSQNQVCAICSHSDHTIETCHMCSFTDQEQANYVGQNNYFPKNNPYSNTDNLGWRNHPNFSWSSNSIVLNPQGQQRISQQAVRVVQESKKSDLESIVFQLATSQQELMAEQRQFKTNQRQVNAQTSQAMQKLEAQMGQMARELSERKQGEFPTQTITNPGGH